MYVLNICISLYNHWAYIIFFSIYKTEFENVLVWLDHIIVIHMCVPAQSLQSCLNLCDPMDSNLPGSSVHGFLQARILECPPPGDLATQGLNLCLLCLLHW